MDKNERQLRIAKGFLQQAFGTFRITPEMTLLQAIEYVVENLDVLAVQSPKYPSYEAMYNRCRAECDLLLFAIRPEEYASIQARMVAISETPDEKTGALSGGNK